MAQSASEIPSETDKSAPLPLIGRTIFRRVADHKLMYLFLLPAVVLTFIFAYIPMVGVVMAFQDFSIVKGYAHSDFVGFDNFAKALDNPDFYVALKNTLAMNGLLIVIGFPLPILFALLLNEMKHEMFKRFTQTITYLPHFISWVVISGLVYRMLDENIGSLNLILSALGHEKIPFMREAQYFWSVLVSSSVWKELGWNSIIFLAAIVGIDSTLYESATMDGAGRLRKMVSITIPGIMPVIGLMFIFKIGTIVGGMGGGASFDAVYNLMNSMVSDKAMTLDYHVFIEGIRRNEPAYAAAVGLAFSLIALALVLISNAISKKISGYRAF